MLLFYHENLTVSKEIILAEDEAKHCLKVLRMKIGDTLHLTDGNGNLATVKIVTDNLKKCVVDIENITNYTKNNKHFIHIAIAPTKNAERMEWFVEKCVEIGVDEISFLQTEHTERTYFNDERILKKAISAMKQSLNFHLPKLNPLRSLENFYKSDFTQDHRKENTQLFIAYVDKTNPETLFKSAIPNKNYCVLIGPEGDFSKTELEQALELGFRCVSLGNSRLRTETAGIVACNTLNLLNEPSV
jgi:16S rRNA (uracil1498-N3)-methyltransferase